MAVSASACRESSSASAAVRRAVAPFNAGTFNDEGLFVLGAAGFGTAEVGEVLTAFDAINARTGNPAELARSDFDAYVGVFLATAARLAALAQSSGHAGQTVTARYQHLRASNYFTQALFFVLGTSRPAREEASFDLVNQQFHAALAARTPAPVQFTVQAGRARQASPAVRAKIRRWRPYLASSSRQTSGR